MPVQKKRLGETGLEVSIIGFGASPLGSIFDQEFEPEDGIKAVLESFRLGINYFDTSPFYGNGQSEEILGRAFKALPRSEIVVSSKVGRYGVTDFDFSASRVTESIDQSLQRMQLEYLDIVQCHDIEFTSANQIIKETIPALLEAKKTGRVRNIGITGLPLKIYRNILDAFPPGTLDVVLSYCHNTLFDDTISEMLPFFEMKRVGVINASPLSMGLLSPHGEPAWHPASKETKDACRAARKLCAEKGISLPKIALFHSIHNHPEISTTLVGMPSVAEVQENVETAMLTQLSPEEKSCLESIQSILKPIQNQTWFGGLPENN